MAGYGSSRGREVAIKSSLCSIQHPEVVRQQAAPVQRRAAKYCHRRVSSNQIFVFIAVVCHIAGINHTVRMAFGGAFKVESIK